MALIHCMPINQAMTKEELGARLASGWVYVGQMAVQEGGGVLDPTKPTTATGAVVSHVWLLPEPALPVGALVQVLASLYHQEDKRTLNAIARQLFGRTVPEIMSAADQLLQEGKEETP